MLINALEVPWAALNQGQHANEQGAAESDSGQGSVAV